MMATRNTGPSYDLSLFSLKLSKYLFFDKKGLALTEAVIFCKNLRRDFIIFLFINDQVYSKKGIPGIAYFFIPSSFISTPMPGFSDSVIKLSFTHSPSYF